MTTLTFNTNPNELTSFDGGYTSPETSGTLLKFLIDFVRPTSSAEPSQDEAISSEEELVEVSSVADHVTGQSIGDEAEDTPGETKDEGISFRNAPALHSLRNVASLKPSLPLQIYSKSEDSHDFKKYWMPDDQCKECYECETLFTTFKRRHHCRLCGQIFCYDCCSDIISGKISGSGNAEVQLRVCKYCLELKSKHQKLEKKRFSKTEGLIFSSPSLDRPNEPDSPTMDILTDFNQEELKEEDVQKINQHFMWSLFRSPSSTVPAQPAWYRFRYFSHAYFKVDILTWFHEHLQKPEDALPMLDAWIETSRLEPVNPAKTIFRVGPKDDYNENTVLLYEQIKKEPEQNTTNWIHRMIQEAKASSQSFEIHNSGSVSSFIHVDMDKDLDDEFWQSSESAVNTSQSLDDTICLELNGVIDSMNSTAKLFLNSENEVEEHTFKNAELLGIDVVNQCVRQEKNPDLNLHIPSFGIVDKPDLDHQSGQPPQKISNLSRVYEEHSDAILDTLIDKEGISSVWRPILRKLVSEAANDVSPNPMNGDSMDIRKYVKFKKLHGHPDGSEILDGYVISKTIAHKKMKSHIINPKIMLMNGSISYQRVLNKLTSLNPVFLQEKEYLSKVIDRVESFKPDVLIVEKSVSQIAKDELLSKGITLILNLKQGQIEKIARNVQGDIIQNLENVNFIPIDDSNESSKNRLGHCKEFCADFMKGFYGSNKALVFFSGCERNLTKTIILRGESKIVLKKVKKVASHYLYAMYNRRLEFHYIKRNGLVWKYPDHGFRSHSQLSEASGNTFVNNSDVNGHTSPRVISVSSDQQIVRSSSSGSADSEAFLSGLSPSNPFDVNQDCSSDEVSEGSLDNLHDSVNQDVLFDELVCRTLFSITPFCRPSVPYLCTSDGNNCPIREFFDDQIYYSQSLLPQSVSDYHVDVSDSRMKHDSGKCESLSPIKPVITSFTPDDFAFYRAFGYWESEKDEQKHTGILISEECHPEAPHHIQCRLEQNMRGKELDCLDFYNHQKLLVLFSSLSIKSFNHPHPCISPWSLNMQFYGKNDLTLGLFLRDYCYLSTYQCPEQSCKTDIVDHERRFVHAGQCVNLKMSKLSAVVDILANTPITWSVCNKCLFMSDITIVSKETWNYSFAKFLELKFYEKCLYVKDTCTHAFHRHHTNFFALGNIVACFTRTDVKITEVCPLVPRFNFQDNFTDITASNCVFLNETVTKTNAALKAVQEKIDGVNGCDDVTIKEARAKLAAEDALFKQKISDLTRSVTESPIFVRREIYKIQSDIFFCIDTWNKYLAVIKRRPKSSSKQAIGLSCETLNSSRDELDQMSPKLSIEEGDKSAKTHKRVYSDTYLLEKARTITRCGNDSRGLSRSMDDIFEKTNVKSDERTGFKSPKLSKLHNESTSSRYSKMALKTKKFFNAITDPYKKIEQLFPVEEHHRLTGGSRPTVLVNEKHFTSIIAYALSCDQYRAKLQLLKPEDDVTEVTKPTHVRRASAAHVKPFSSVPHDEEKVGHWLTVTSNVSGGDQGSSGEIQSLTHGRKKSADLTSEENVINKSNHIDVEFQDGPTKFFCKVYFAAEFDKLRSLLMPGEALHDFIHSLSYCNKWRAKGGKSGLAFSKTQDDRWVVKEMSRLELQALLMFMPNYVEYVIDSIDKRPTLLAKIVGACTVGFSNTHTGISMRQDVIIMENILYNVTPTVVYDLKGSVRNRLAEEHDEVLLDENYLHHIVDDPVYLRPHSKTFLREAVNCDTAFLAAQSIIDYSLLVGMCGDRIVVGIIDYIRKFTFDKKVEMIFKTNMIGSAGRMPTIVSPEMYRERFCNQIERYFPLVPDRWTGMGSDLQYS